LDDGSRVRWSPSPCRRSRLDFIRRFSSQQIVPSISYRGNSNVVSTHRPQRRRAKLTCTRIMVPITQATATRSTARHSPGVVVATRCLGSDDDVRLKRSAFGRDEYLYLVAVPYSIVATVTTSLAVVRQWPARNASIPSALFIIDALGPRANASDDIETGGHCCRADMLLQARWMQIIRIKKTI
jgi:hypothetical protein